VTTNKTKSRHALKRDGFLAFWRLTQTPYKFLYGLFATTFVAGLLVSSWALTFWVCAACSLGCAVRTPHSFLLLGNRATPCQNRDDVSTEKNIARMRRLLRL
jgi:hypothetical protein